MKFIILVLALLYGSEVMACSLDPRVYDLKAFLAKSKNGDVVFTGRVVSVTTSEDGR